MSRIGKLSILLATYCKSQLAQNSESSWFQGPFFMISGGLGGLGINFHADLGIVGTQTCSLACLVTSLWRPGGALGRSLDIGEDTWRSRLGFYCFLADLGDPF